MPILLLALALLAPSAFANTSDTICTIAGTEIHFDLGTNTPPDAGSRIFYQIDFFATKAASQPTLTVPDVKTDRKYRVAYHDDGQGNWELSIFKGKTRHRAFHARWRFKTATAPTQSEVVSTLPGLAGKGTLDCAD